MRTIHKFRLSLVEPNLLTLPIGHKIRHVDIQRGEVFLWIEVDTDVIATERVGFGVYGTGHQIPLDEEYVGTTQMGPFVWHIYRD